MLPQKLTLNDVLEAGRKAYSEGTLAAQHPIPALRRCEYETQDKKYHCVVGTALSREVLDNVHCSGWVSTLVKYGLIEVDDSVLRSLGRLQDSHDDWCTFSREFTDSDRRAVEAKEKFCKLLGVET